MRPTLPHPLLNDSITIAATVSTLFPAIAKRDKNLLDQVRRAMSSVVLNLAEAMGSDAGNARARFATARGSLLETRAGIRLANAYGYIDDATTDRVDALLDRLGARIWGAAR